MTKVSEKTCSVLGDYTLILRRSPRFLSSTLQMGDLFSTPQLDIPPTNKSRPVTGCKILSSTLQMGAPGHPKGEVEPDVLLSRCSGKSLRDFSCLQSGEKTLKKKSLPKIINYSIHKILTNDMQEYIDIIKVFEKFNNNISVLKRMNRPYESIMPLSNRPFRFEIMLRKLFYISEMIIQKIKIDRIDNITPFSGLLEQHGLKSRLLSIMDLTRDEFYKSRHVRF
jgi:hypothetical protein